MKVRSLAVVLAALPACSSARPMPAQAAPPGSSSAAPPAPSATLVGKSVPLPGTTGPVTVDYSAYDKKQKRVWIPVGETGTVSVFDVAAGTFARVDGFKTAEREVRGKKRMVGPSAVTIGEGFAYVANRATSEICAVDSKTLKVGACLKLPSPGDAVLYVAAAKEVWVTTPKDAALIVLDAAKADALKPKLLLRTEGEPEGLAFDEVRGLVYTNLEDKNRTIAVDLKTHTLKSTWSLPCGPDGPRGVAVDAQRNFVFVACTDSVQVLDGGHGGALLGKLEAGAGVDNVDYQPTPKLLFVAAAKAARLTAAQIDDKGKPLVVAVGATSEGSRNPVVDPAGAAFVADGPGARLWVFPPPAR